MAGAVLGLHNFALAAHFLEWESVPAHSRTSRAKSVDSYQFLNDAGVHGGDHQKRVKIGKL